MSLLQRIFTAVLPRRWAESMEADSRRWLVRCSCGFARSVWDLGGVRWQATSRPRTFPRTFIKGPQCGQRSWHRVTRELSTTAPPSKV